MCTVVVMQEESLHVLCACVCAFIPMRNSRCNTLHVLILNDNSSTCVLTGGDIIKAFSTFISFDIDSNCRVDLRI